MEKPSKRLGAAVGGGRIGGAHVPVPAAVVAIAALALAPPLALPVEAVAGASSAAAATSSGAAARSASASPSAASGGVSLESAASKADSVARKVAMSLIGLGFAIAAVVLIFRRDFKEAAGVFAVGLLAILLATPAGVGVLHATVNTLFGSS